MFVSVHYVDNVRNVKTERGGITGHIYCNCIILHANEQNKYRLLSS